MLEYPIAGKRASHFKAWYLPKDTTLQPNVFFHCFSFLHCSAKALVPKPLATRDFDQPQNLTSNGLRLLHTLIKAAWSSLTAICESTLVKSLPVLAQMLNSNPGSRSQASEICIPKMHSIQTREGIWHSLLWISLSAQGVLSEPDEALLSPLGRITAQPRSAPSRLYGTSCTQHGKPGDPTEGPAICCLEKAQQVRAQLLRVSTPLRANWHNHSSHSGSLASVCWLWTPTQ